MALQHRFFWPPFLPFPYHLFSLPLCTLLQTLVRVRSSEHVIQLPALMQVDGTWKEAQAVDLSKPATCWRGIPTALLGFSAQLRLVQRASGT